METMLPSDCRTYRRSISTNCRGEMNDDEDQQQLGSDSLIWQPKHVLTRRTAKIVGEAKCVWNARLGFAARTVPAAKIQSLLNDMQLYPTNAQGTFSHHDVFLGGSCNPTTWRREQAIPLLDELGITYFNPQVSHWSPDLMEMEHRAKESAKMLLFVIDNKTRNVVSIVEMTLYAGSGRNMAVVLNSGEIPGPFVGEEKLSEQEFLELKTSLVLMKKLIQRRNIPVFESVHEAVRYSAKQVTVESSKVVKEVKNNYKNVKIREAFEAIDGEKRGYISSKDVCKALRMLTRQRSHSAEMRRNIAHTAETVCRAKDFKINYEQFCKIVSELTLSGEKNSDRRRSNFSTYFRSISMPDETSTNGTETKFLTDVYLGGDCCGNWRKNVAVPLLRKSCITFYNPEVERPCDRTLTNSELDVIGNCHILLFVVTDSSRALFTMTLAAYYLGVGANVVLCIQELPENCIISGEKLSEQAIKDYNRGRSYLTDFALRCNVPVFKSIAEAVNETVSRCTR